MPVGKMGSRKGGIVTYAIRFEFPEGPPAFAGDYKGAAGFAPSLRTAILFEDEDAAHRILTNAYGEQTQKYGRVILVRDGGVA